MSGKVRVLLLVLLVAGAVLVAFLNQPDGAEASGHGATRAFASPSVAPGGQMQVTITAQNYGAFARVVEWMPGGFRYVGSSLPDSAVNVRLNEVTFTLLGEEQFTYTVEAPTVAATFSFSGTVRDQHNDTIQIGGDTNLQVGAVPTPIPTPAPTAAATATASATPMAARTPTPAATSTPVPTATPRPAPAGTPMPGPTATQAPESAATPTPEPEPTATPVPEPTATPVPVVQMRDEEGGIPLWVWILPFVVLALIGGSIAYARSRA